MRAAISVDGNRCTSIHPHKSDVRCTESQDHNGLHVNDFTAWSSSILELTYSPTKEGNMKVTLITIVIVLLVCFLLVWAASGG